MFFPDAHRPCRKDTIFWAIKQTSICLKDFQSYKVFSDHNSIKVRNTYLKGNKKISQHLKTKKHFKITH